MSNRLLSVQDYLRLPCAAEAWFIEPLLPVGGTLLIYGEPKVGKSYFMLQLCEALAGTQADFLGFVVKSRVRKLAYVQLDTPRSLWALRMRELVAKSARIDHSAIFMTDRELLGCWPFNILNPVHASILKDTVAGCDVVIIDTIRAAHNGKENDSDVMQEVVNQLSATVQPAALILVSHSRKPSLESGPSVLNDNRGSGSVVGAVDTILKLSKKSLHYVGRGIEEGSIKVDRVPDTGFWESETADLDGLIISILKDDAYPSLRAKAKLLSERLGRSEEACRSLLRRAQAGQRAD